jgi:hypothetical protein
LFGTQIGTWVKLAIAAVGFLSIYLGYKLFCDIPFRGGRTFRTIFLVNLVSGAALALFGVGVLTADLRSMRNDRNGAGAGAVHHQRAVEDGSFTGPKMRRNPKAAASAA